MKFTSLTYLLPVFAIAACSSTSGSDATTQTSVMTQADGGFVVTTANTEITVPADSLSITNRVGRVDQADLVVRSYAIPDVVAVAGRTDTERFAALSGTPATPRGFRTVYNTFYSVITDDAVIDGADVEMIYSQDDGTLTLDDGTIVVAGIVDDATFTGTVTYGGADADLNGGFFDDNDAIGIFSGDTFVGILGGESTSIGTRLTGNPGFGVNLIGGGATPGI